VKKKSSKATKNDNKETPSCKIDLSDYIKNKNNKSLKKMSNKKLKKKDSTIFDKSFTSET
jgi:hypothetical protein